MGADSLPHRYLTNVASRPYCVGMDSNTLLPGSDNLWTAAKNTCAAKGFGMRKWSASDKKSLKATLEYVRRSYKSPGAVFPQLVPHLTTLTCGQHNVAVFSTWEIANAAEAIARQSAEECGLRIGAH
jgi:hypothetical protein